MFRKPWLLVLWAISILMAVSTFIGEGGGVDQLGKAAKQIRAQKEAQGGDAPIQAVAVEEGAETGAGTAPPEEHEVSNGLEVG